MHNFSYLILFHRDDFLKLSDGLFEVLVSHFVEFVFILKFDRLLFRAVCLFVPIVEILENLLLQCLPGLCKFLFRSDIIELGNELLVCIV